MQTPPQKPAYLWLYQRLLTLLSPLIVIWLIRESWQHKNIQLLMDRFAYHKDTSFIKVDHWFHCASVGEVNVIAPLVTQQTKQNKTLLITCFTPTGLAHAQQKYAHLANLHFRLLPFDWRWTVRKLLNNISCHYLFIVETELWPQLIQQAAEKGMVIALINARLSHKTRNSYAWLRQLNRQLINRHIHQVLCRHQDDRVDFSHYGVVLNKLVIAGNLKWCHNAHNSTIRLLDEPYVVLASSHHPEEIEVAKRWQHTQLPKLVIVPRHPKRGARIANELEQHSIPFSQRSINKHATQGIILADTFGELHHWFAYAQWVIMGGSFVPKGGQNPLEAISAGKTVLSGPDMSDFLDEVRQLAAFSVIKQVQNYDELLLACYHDLPSADNISAAQHYIHQQQQQIHLFYQRWFDELP